MNRDGVVILSAAMNDRYRVTESTPGKKDTADC